MHKYFVSGNEQLTPSTLLLTLKKDISALPLSFQPGQYAAISFKRRGRPTPARCFSIVSSPTDQDTLQFSARTKGRFTKALQGIKLNDEVLVRGAFGGFVFDADRDKEAVLLAGGIGVTPFLSMIRYASDLNLTNKITLVFSCQNQDDVPFAKELKKLQRDNHNFRAVYIIGDGPTNKFADYDVETGRINPEIMDRIVNKIYTDKTFFVCGPPPFMKAVTKLVSEKGAPKTSIVTEAFSQGPNRQTGKILGWPYNIYAVGALGVLILSATVMASDLLKTLPPSTSLESNSTKPSLLTSDQPFELDKIVNDLPSKASNAPPTHAVKQALKAAEQAAAAPQATTPTSTPAQTSSPAPEPTAAPAPKCTTTQSGVSTCN